MNKNFLLMLILIISAITTNMAQGAYQTFTEAGFQIKCGCTLESNTEFIQIAKSQGVNKILGAYICAENETDFNLGVINNIVVYDESKNYNGLQQSGYAAFEKKYINQYTQGLKGAGIEYTQTTYQGVNALEYTFEQQGLPTKAIFFLKNKKSYLIQVGTRTSLVNKFNQVKSTFKSL